MFAMTGCGETPKTENSNNYGSGKILVEDILVEDIIVEEIIVNKIS